MRLISLELESKLRDQGLWPQSWIAWAALYVLALDLLLFAAQWLTRRASPAISASLGGLGNFSQRAGDCVARDCRLPLAALATAVAAAQPADRHLCFYRRDSGFSAGDDFADHALSSCRAVRQLRRNFRHRHSPAQHGGSQPRHRPSSGDANLGRRKAGCGNPRPNQAASSGVVAAAGVRVASEPAAALLLGAGGRGWL